MKLKINKGFTIVEVLVVIGIIAILTVIIFPSISNIRAKNRDAEKVSDIAAIQLGLSLYYNQHQIVGYPADLSTLSTGNYITADSLATPDGGTYIYVPLKRGTGSKCSYYHLGVRLELPSAQIDTADTFTSATSSSISSGYSYCGIIPTPYVGVDIGLENMYAVHP